MSDDPEPHHGDDTSGLRGDVDEFDALVESLGALSVEQADNFERGLRHLREIRKQFDEPHAQPHTMAEPCPMCQTRAGVLVVKGNQTTIRCRRCHRFMHRRFKVAGDDELVGAAADSPVIEPAQRARIIDRDAGRCVLCGASESLTVGHLLAVADGVLLGATTFELGSDANLAALCQLCSVGLASSHSSVSPRTYAAIMWRLVQHELQHRPRTDTNGAARRNGR